MFALILVLGGRSVILQPKEEPLYAEGVLNDLARFMICVGCLTYVRSRYGWRIARNIDRSREATSSQQFSLKSLFQWTAFFALIFLFWRSLSRRLDWEPFSDKWSEFFVGWFVGSLCIATFTLLTLLTLAPSLINKFAVVTTVFTAIAVVIEQQIATFIDTYPHALYEVSLLMLGGAMAGILAALPLRLAGYRFSNWRAADSCL
jgi:hypothetical protein